MAKTSVLHARVDNDLKENVEYILSELGLSTSDAINLFYKQIELSGGLPFELKVPQRILNEKKLLTELNKGKLSGEQNGWMTLEESKAKLGL